MVTKGLGHCCPGVASQINIEFVKGSFSRAWVSALQTNFFRTLRMVVLLDETLSIWNLIHTI